MRYIGFVLSAVVIVILSIPFSGFCQEVESNSVTNQIWLDYNPNYKLSEKHTLYGDNGIRTIFPNQWYRMIVRPSIKYERPKFILKDLKYKAELHAGIGFFFTANVKAVNRLEIRPFQGYQLTWPNRERIDIQHYVRLEERF